MRFFIQSYILPFSPHIIHLKQHFRIELRLFPVSKNKPSFNRWPVILIVQVYLDSREIKTQVNSEYLRVDRYKRIISHLNQYMKLATSRGKNNYKTIYCSHQSALGRFLTYDKYNRRAKYTYWMVQLVQLHTIIPQKLY